jgi:S1-C subfamily serine protease
MSWKKVLGFILAMFILGGTALVGAMAGGVVVYQLMSNNQSAATPVPTEVAVQVVPAVSQTQTLDVNTVDVETAITKAVQTVGPSVVTVVGTIPGQQTFFGFTGDSTSTGSGVFISSDGYILTNNHVIEGAQQLQVIFADGSQQDATLVGTDQYSDLAVLKIKGAVPAVATVQTNTPIWQCLK